MKDLVIISKNKKYILEMEKYFAKLKLKQLLIIQKLDTKTETKLAIAFSKQFSTKQILNVPLKRCFKCFKRKYFFDLDLGLDSKEINRLVNLNIDREFEICLKDITINDRLYIDSLFCFLTKEIKESWNKISVILKENIALFGLKNNDKNNVIKFVKNNPQKTKDK